MRYLSLNGGTPATSFRQATIEGQAPDKGLYYPEHIPLLPATWIRSLASYSRQEIAFRVIEPYVGEEIPRPVLEEIVSQTISFDFPLVQLTRDIYALELFHGPTLAFKDVGARFMSRCMGYFVRQTDEQLIVLVATSGDTGGAVADGFFKVDGVQVVILFPKGKVSPVQELQLTTYGHNIRSLEVDGTFDDCQHMVKQAFADPELRKALFMTSANSINVARWLPQQFYYFFALKQWTDLDNPPVISVPSGNFGNICAGLLALRSGLPVNHFVAACNTNDVVTTYLREGSYRPKPAVPTISNAMDVGNPSNWVRILELFDRQFHTLKKVLSSYSYSDDWTRKAIARLWKDYHYLADPHGAIGFLALENYLQDHPGLRGIFLETAHPIKFPDAVEPLVGRKLPLPDKLKTLSAKQKRSISLRGGYDELRDYLLSLNK